MLSDNVKDSRNSDFWLASSESDVVDIIMLVTLWWWLISEFGGRIIMLATFFVDFLNVLKSVY